jgi:hypothetical protein
MRMIDHGRHRTRARVVLVACALALSGWSCAHGGGASAPAPAPAHPRGPRLTLHWNDAADTSRLLRVPGNQSFRTDLTLTGLADSLQGFHIEFRMEPTSNVRGTAWRFADSDSCLAGVWAGTAEKDPHAPAPWPSKLMITDVQPQPDGSVVFMVAVTFDLVAMNPDSTYSVCHMIFTPPEAKSDSVTCSGWDAPMRLGVESAKLLFTQIEEPIFELGKALQLEVLPPTGPKTGAQRP